MQIRFHRRPQALHSKTVYLLDLDNTLHFASAHILPEINRQMTQYLANTLNLTTQQASQLRTDYWIKYGATLLGMMRHHGTDPHHFLHHTHQFTDLEKLSFRPGAVPQTLKRLKGRRVLLTNAPKAYAVDLLKALDLYRHLDAVIAIEDMVIHRQWRPKPSRWLWPLLKTRLKANRPIFVDDTLGHLHQAARHGYTPVWITKPGLGFKSRRPVGRVVRRIKKLSHLVEV